MVKTYERGQNKTGKPKPTKEAKKCKSSTVVGTVKARPTTKPALRTIKSAPKRGSIPRESIENAIKKISSLKKKK